MTPPPNTKNYTPIEGEKWRHAVGFSDKYYVSNMGRLLTMSAHGKPNNPAIMKPCQSFDKRRSEHRQGRYGYMKTAMDGQTVAAHRIVAQTWIPNSENKPFINHINGNKTDNRAENLEWCTGSENIKHAFRTGLMKKVIGENHHAARLTNEQVRQFKWEWAHDRKMTRKQYAEALGVSEAAIKDIIRGRSWKWLQITSRQD